MRTSARRLTTRAAVITAPIVVSAALATTPATAGFVTPSLVAPQMQLQILDVPGVGFHVCAYGSTTAPTAYQLSVTGQRSDGTTINLSTGYHGTSWRSGNRLQVTENLAPAGNFTATYTITATSTNRAGIATGGGTWDPYTGEHSWDTA